MNDPARVVAAGYDEVADRYAALEGESGSWPRTRHVEELAERLPRGAAVLDLGCGNGVPVAVELAEAGFDVTGVDVSPEQVRRAWSAVPAGMFLVADMLSAELPEEAYDAVVSTYAIDHVPRERHLEVFRLIHGWLRPGGLALVAIEDDDQPGAVGEWLGATMFFSTNEAPVTVALLERAGLRVLESAVETQVEQGVDVAYTWVLAQRPDYDQLR